MSHTKVTVPVLPPCDVHKHYTGRLVPAAYDAKTTDGRWANLCEPCFSERGLGLGLGLGQRLVLQP